MTARALFPPDPRVRLDMAKAKTRLRRDARTAKLPGQVVPERLREWLTARARLLGWSRAALVRHLLERERERVAACGTQQAMVMLPLDVVPGKNDLVTLNGRAFRLVPVE